METIVKFDATDALALITKRVDEVKRSMRAANRFRYLRGGEGTSRVAIAGSGDQ